MEMRELISKELENEMRKNENIVVLNADLAKPNAESATKLQFLFVMQTKTLKS